MGDDEGGSCRKDEGVCAEAEEGRAVAAVGDVGCGEGGGSSEWWEDGEEEARFFVREDGIEEEVSNVGDED